MINNDTLVLIWVVGAILYGFISISVGIFKNSAYTWVFSLIWFILIPVGIITMPFYLVGKFAERINMKLNKNKQGGDNVY